MQTMSAYAVAVGIGLCIAAYAELGGPGVDTLQVWSDTVMEKVLPSAPVQSEPWTDLYGQHRARLHALDQRLGRLSTSGLDVDALARLLTEGTSSELERAYVIHRWVSSHIRYDQGGFLVRNFRNTSSPKVVLDRRAGVCDGIAGLVTALGQAAGLRIEKVLGEARGEHQRVVDRSLTRHAWNRVQIGQRWFLLDPTWDIATRPDERTEVLRWFLVDPERMIRTHLPNSTRWQLLTPPVSRAAFHQTVR